VEFTPEASGPTTVAVAMQQTVEVQAITWNASAPTQLDAYDEHGGIVLSIGGKDADEIAWDSTAEDVAQAISGLGWGDVEVSRGVFKGTDEMRMYDAAALRGLQIDNAHYVYSITFSDYVGDVPELEVLEPRGGSLRVDWDQGVTTKEITKGSFGVVKASDAWPVRSRPWVNDQLVREVQVVRVDHGVTHSEGNFTLTFKGQETRHIPVNATAGQVKRALEELETVGQVDVARRGNPATGSNAGGTTRLDNYEWAVTFGRGRGTEVDLTNLGDQPSMGGRNVTQTSTDSVRRSTSPITVYTSGAVSSGGVASVDGVAPFASVVYPNAVSAPNCTAVDLSGVAGRDGLKTGFFERASSFIIEARDAFGNMNPYGPRAEVQVVDVFSNTPAAANHSGNAFSLSYLGEAVEVPFGAGVKDLEDLLESLPEVGAVTVTTTGATHDVKCRANATFGVAVIEPSCDLRTTFGPGDWIRVGHNESYGRLRNEDAKNLKPWAASPERGPPDAHTHVFTVVRVAQKAPYAITLSGPWPYASDANVALYEQGRNEKNARDAYRYVVTFDTLLGDLPPLVATPLSTKFATDVTYCERYRYQEIRTHEQGVNNTHQHYEFQQAADRDFKVGSNYVNGTFTLSFGGQTTRQLPSNIEPAALKTALEDDLDDVITASVIYRRGPFGPGEYKWLVRLDATVGDVLEPMYAEGYLLTGAHASVVADDDTCPEAPDNGAGEKAASQAGRLGTQFVARLSGPESVNADVTYAGQGLYDATYATPRIGSYLVDVSATEQGGLVGQYFNNRWLYGEPVSTRVDHSVDFEFEVEDRITDTGRDHVSVRWTGFVRPSFDEIFTFHAQVNDGARLFVDGELLFDAFENEVDEAGGIPYEEFSGATAKKLNAGALVDITLEWRETTGRAVARLLWSSPSQPYGLVPPSRLFHHADQSVIFSPFAYQPQAVKASAPENVRLARGDWDEVIVAWDAPVNDGGEPVSSYKVEWWSNVPGDVGALEVQTLRIPRDAPTSASFHLYSGGGYKYPWALGVDTCFHHDHLCTVRPTALEVETALEFLYDVGDVSVEQPFDEDNFVNYRITFSTDTGSSGSSLVGRVGAISVDGAGFGGVGVQPVICHGTSTSAGCGADLFQDGNFTANHSTAVSLDVEPGAPYRYAIQHLFQHSGVADGFGVRVAAGNAAGYGVASGAVSLKPYAVADAPEETSVERVPGAADELRVQWQLPLWPHDRQAEVTSFLIEYATAADFSQAANVTLSRASCQSARLTCAGGDCDVPGGYQVLYDAPAAYDKTLRNDEFDWQVANPNKVRRGRLDAPHLEKSGERVPLPRARGRR
jgi:hypothetical protein